MKTDSEHAALCSELRNIHSALAKSDFVFVDLRSDVVRPCFDLGFVSLVFLEEFGVDRDVV